MKKEPLTDSYNLVLHNFEYQRHEVASIMIVETSTNHGGLFVGRAGEGQSSF